MWKKFLNHVLLSQLKHDILYIIRASQLQQKQQI